MLTHGSLFSGIGGIDLGFERAGIKTRWQVEQDEYCNRVLEKHWPDVRRYGDIREIDGRKLEPVDIISGGFPCQDISCAGKGKGLSGSRSGLFYEMARVVAEARPKYVILENVPRLTRLGLDIVGEELRLRGYQPLRPLLIEAASFGAPHKRERIFVVAYNPSKRIGRLSVQQRNKREKSIDAERSSKVAHSESDNQRGTRETSRGQQIETGGRGTQSGEIPDTDNTPTSRQREHGGEAHPFSESEGFGLDSLSEWWAVEPYVDRVAYGIPSRVDRLRGIGNAVVPQVAELIGRIVIDLDKRIGDIECQQ